MELLDVKLPARKKGSGRKLKYPFNTMDIDKSFFAENTKLNSMRSCADSWAKRNGGDKSFKARECWKLENEYDFEDNGGTKGVLVYRVK